MDGKRKSYKTSSRRQRILDDGTEELGDLSDDDDAENLERKIARLKREIEEAKEEQGRLQAESEHPKQELGQASGDLDSLSRVLEEISNLQDTSAAISKLALRAIPEPPQEGAKETAGEAGPEQLSSGTQPFASPLAQAADFDRRLVLLEKAIGISSPAASDLDSTTGLPRAILPTLDSLQQQVSTLSGASTASLDSISRRVRTLTTEANELEKARKAARIAHDALGGLSTPPPSAVGVALGDPEEAAAAAAAVAAAADDSEQTAKINALYGTLPTIESLAPLLPPLLDRLRSLRAIHADAATASENLERVERDQADMAGEIKQWREGLDRLEAGMKDSEKAMTGNAKVMEGWVKDLEERVKKLS